MKIFNSLFKKFVYRFTKKPSHYVRIDKPKSLQDCRQLQYNRWCKAVGSYSGSYLPKNPNKLMESGKKGWKEITVSYDKTKSRRTFQRKSSAQIVDYHKKATKKMGLLLMTIIIGGFQL